MSAIASQITSLTIVYSTVYPGAFQSKHQSSASLAFVWGIHRGPVNSPHKWPVTRKVFPFDNVIMNHHTSVINHICITSNITMFKPTRTCNISFDIHRNKTKQKKKWRANQHFYIEKHTCPYDERTYDHRDIKNNAWVTVNNDFLSRVRRFGNDFPEWRSHEWKYLPNRLTSDKTSLFTVTNVLFYFVHAIYH